MQQFTLVTFVRYCSGSSFSLKNGAKSSRCPRLSEIWERDKTQLVPSGEGAVNFQNCASVLKLQSASAPFLEALFIRIAFGST